MSKEPPMKRLRVENMDLQSDSSEVELMEVESADSSASSILMCQKPALDILNQEFPQIDSQHVAEIRSLTELTNHKVEKAIKFTSECNLVDVVQKYSIINTKLFPSAFIFVIEHENFGLNGPDDSHIKSFLKTLFLNDSFATRPLILQLTSKSENLSNLFYKKQKSNDFSEIKSCEKIGNFVNSFFWSFVSGEIKNFDDNLSDFLLGKTDSALIIKFLNIFKIPGEFLWKLKLKCAVKGSKNEFLAAFGNSFDDYSILQNIEAQSILNRTFLLQFHQNFVNQSNNYHSEMSILLLALENSNNEVLEYLITKCSYLIQQLPFDHQVKVTTAAFNNQQFDILCELIEDCDFPFPDNFNIMVINNRLHQLAKTRSELFTAIQFGDIPAINNFIDNNQNLKIVYNIKNKSSLKQSIDSNRIDIYCLLQFHGFQPAYNEDFENFFTSSQGEQIAEIKIKYSSKNSTVMQLANRSFPLDRKNNKEEEEKCYKNIKKWYEEIYKSKFGKELFNSAAQCDELQIIFDFESEFVNDIDKSLKDEAFGSTYPHKKWIFIGAKMTKNKNREQEIRGTIAHEFSHYVLNLIFDNKLKPYSKKSNKIAELFDEIVKSYSHWFHSAFASDGNEDDDVNDGCNRIISSVYKNYSLHKRHQELIVRVPEILAYFEGDDEKIEQIRKRYKILFIFYETFVLPALKGLNLKDRKSVRMFNKIVGVLQKIWNMEYDLDDSKIPPGYFNRNIIIAANNPLLLLRNICYCLFLNHHQLFDSKSIFLAPKCLENEEILRKLNEILNEERNFDIYGENSDNLLSKFKNEIKPVVSDVSMKNVEDLDQFSNGFVMISENLMNNDTNFDNSEDDFNENTLELVNITSKLNIIVDCSKETGKFLDQFSEILSHKNANFIFVVSNENKNEKLTQILREKIGVEEMVTIDYSWNDLTAESQNLLLDRKVFFQNNSKMIFKNLFVEDAGPLKQHPGDSTIFSHNHEFTSIIDSQLLNLLMDKLNEIQINTKSNEELKAEEFFETIFQTRNFIKKSSREVEKVMTIDEFESQKCSRKFKNEEIDENNETIKVTEIIKINENISLEDQLEEVQNQKFVLISDTAGTGKSWMLKYVANTLQTKYPGKWLIRVNLNQFIDEFKSHNSDFNFVNFMTEKVIKSKEKFELKIFKKLYENGKAFILFDGFDEIYSDCAEPVIKLLKCFEQNGGNQLWITTRDYFEVEMQEMLNIDTVYKLDEFTEDYGIKLISLNWTLKHLNNKNVKIQEKTLEEKQSHNLQKIEHYKQKARNLLNKIPKLTTRKIGYPLFYKIVTEIYEHKQDEEIILTLYKTYSKYTIKQYQIWSNEKGKNWNEESIILQMDGSNFVLVHQFYAMKNLFTNISNFCDLKIEGIRWSEIQIVNFGLISININKFVFIHETFCEFYAAEFVLRILKNGLWEIYEDFFMFLKILLTVRKFDVVRMFINEGWNENSISSIMEGKSKNFAERFDKFVIGNENFSNIFEENLGYLVAFLIDVFDCLNYNKVKNILFSNICNIINVTKNSSIYLKLQGFYMRLLNVDDLKNFLTDTKIFRMLTDSTLSHEVLEDLIARIDERIDENFTKQMLKPNDWDLNLLATAITSNNFNTSKLQSICSIVDKYLGRNELMTIVSSCIDYQNTSIMHKVMFKNDEERLQIVWQIITKFSNTTKKPFCQILPDLKRNKMRTPFHDALFSKKIQFYKTLWELLLETFTNREDLKNFVLQKDYFDNSFVHMLVSFQTADIIELSFKVLKENLNNLQYKDIITSKGFENRNLLQKAADLSTDISVHQILWKIVRESCDSREDFLKIIMEVDNSNNNVLFMALNFPSSNIFDAMIHELEKFAQSKTIKMLLRLKNGYEQNLLHKSLRFNQSLEMQSGLWKVIKKYFEVEEIRLFAIEHETYGCNILHYAVTYSSVEIAMHTFNEIRYIIDEHELKYYLKTPGFKGKNLYQSALQNSELPQMASWVKNLMTNHA